MRRFLLAGLAIFGNGVAASPSDPVIDSRMTFSEALEAAGAPEAIKTELRLVTVRYWSMDHRLHEGQILCHRLAVDDAEDLFELIERIRFPLRSAIPVSRWAGSDSASMANDNTSGFAWRSMWGSTTPSWHMQGLALDINPRENPAFHKGTISPPDGTRNLGMPGTLSDTSQVVKFLKSRGWKWGAHWRRLQDWQHFEKPCTSRRPPRPIGRERSRQPSRSPSTAGTAMARPHRRRGIRKMGGLEGPHSARLRKWEG